MYNAQAFRLFSKEGENVLPFELFIKTHEIYDVIQYVRWNAGMNELVLLFKLDEAMAVPVGVDKLDLEGRRAERAYHSAG